MLNYNLLNDESYAALRYQLLLNVEETGNPKTTPYLDSKGIPTVGIGFNLRSTNVLNAVLKAFGFDTLSVFGSETGDRPRFFIKIARFARSVICRAAPESCCRTYPCISYNGEIIGRFVLSLTKITRVISIGSKSMPARQVATSMLSF